MRFRLIWLLAIVLGNGAVRSSEPAPPVSLFSLPKIELRASTNQAPGAPPHVQTGQRPSAANHHSEEFIVTAERPSLNLGEADLQSYQSMNDGPVLYRIETPEPIGGAAGWVQEKVWDPVFAPEIVKLGKVKVTGGIVAAVKRKNPFCLLHPLVFAASW